MQAGLNPGFSHTKGFTQVNRQERSCIFPSAVGSPDTARFSLNGADGITLLEPAHVNIGEQAIEQSRFINRQEDRSFLVSDEWRLLALAALSELTQASADITLVTGIPISFYGDKEAVKANIAGAHKVQRAGRNAQTFTLNPVVIPEPFGTLFDQLWDDNLNVLNPSLATGKSGVIDIGSKTTNLLTAQRLKETGHKTDSIETGTWETMRAVRQWLSDTCPRLNLRDHELAKAMSSGHVTYYGQRIDITAIVDSTAQELAKTVIAAASVLFGADLEHIYITGGGALLTGHFIKQHRNFEHAVIVENPIMANARGFWKYARYLASRQ